MSMHTVVNSYFIFIGAIIMLISIIRAKKFDSIMLFVPKNQQQSVKRYLILHHGLMVFFFIGYFGVLAAFVFQNLIISEIFISLIFLMGALYVFICTILQSRLLSEVQNTLNGLLPICARCKKIRTADGEHCEPKVWMDIEKYIMKKSNVEFSHGLCPECYEREIRDIEKLLKK